jgi:hypothetical protein
MMRIQRSVIDLRDSTLVGGDRVRRIQLALASTNAHPLRNSNICAGRCGGEDRPHCSDRGDLVLHPLAWE